MLPFMLEISGCPSNAAYVGHSLSSSFCQIRNRSCHAGLEVASLIDVHQRIVEDESPKESTHKLYGQVLLTSFLYICPFTQWPELL